MPDLGGMAGPFRITTVLHSAHGGYFQLPTDGVNARSITSTNTAIFRATTRFLVTPRNTTALNFTSRVRVAATNNGTITVTRSGAGPAGGTLQYYFLAFNGGTRYTLV